VQALLRRSSLGPETCHACLDALLALVANSALEGGAFVGDGGLLLLRELRDSPALDEGCWMHALETLLLAMRVLRERGAGV